MYVLERLADRRCAISRRPQWEVFDNCLGSLQLQGRARADRVAELGIGIRGSFLLAECRGYRLPDWPATITSTPAILPGSGYTGRLGLAVVLYATAVNIEVGTIGAQFAQNRLIVRATLEAFAHVAAPAAIVATALTA